MFNNKDHLRIALIVDVLCVCTFTSTIASVVLSSSTSLFPPFKTPTETTTSPFSVNLINFYLNVQLLGLSEFVQYQLRITQIILL